jgi:methylmalonyl-CoA mutase N-terminal domain/subunit
MSESRVERWFQALKARGQASVSIDEVGEAIGNDLATTEDIDALFSALEALGIAIRVDGSATPPVLLRAVLSCARSLKDKGERPTAENVARTLGKSLGEVRSALLYAQVLQR